MSTSIERFCELFYASHYIPTALLRGGVAATYPAGYPTRMLAALEPQLRTEQNPHIFTLPELGYYALIRVGEDSVLLGPVFGGAVSAEQLHAFARRASLVGDAALERFLDGIPNYTYTHFANLVAYLHYTLNGEHFALTEHFDASSADALHDLAAAYTQNAFDAKENEHQHGTYQFENMLLALVRDGEVEKLKQFLESTAGTENLREGTLADTPLRQAKNLLIGHAATVGKVGAIGGGLDVEETYRLIDLYTQECEKTASIDAVKLLQYNMLLDFAERVRQSRTPRGVSSEISTCIRCIREHTSESVSIDDLAAQIGRSRAYLTRKFRAEVGTSVAAFITRSRMEDAKRLLRYSDRTLSEISSYLGYSSQAYFQTVFKREVGMTPGEYREQG